MSADMSAHTFVENPNYMNVNLQDSVYQQMQPTSLAAYKEDHQEAQPTFMDNSARYTTELLNQGRSLH